MKGKRAKIIGWGLFALVIIGSAAQVTLQVGKLASAPSLYNLVDTFGWGVAIPLVFSGLGALIISRQPRNRIGWLMMIVGLAINVPTSLIIERLQEPPDHMTTGMWVLIWVNNWSWIPMIFPVFLIPLYFPTGSLPSPRWKWVYRLALGMFLLFLFLTAFLTELSANDGDWSLPNPIGLIPVDFVNGPFLAFWGAGLLTVVSASVVSLFKRYRAASGAERQQIKWLLYSGGVFILIYAMIFFTSDPSAFFQNGWTYLILVLAILGMATAIAIAIFRYRLWDLDVVVNRALIYGPLTTFLAGIFAMVIALTTELTKEALGDQSKALGAAVSAVVVAVVFQPLRDRIKAYVDKRFYPQQEDLVLGLVEVQPAFWGFLDRPTLIRLAVEHVRAVLGAEHAAFYLAKGHKRFQLADSVGGAAQDYPEILLSQSQFEELRRKRVVASGGTNTTAGHVPVFVDRGNSVNLLGLLRIGSRMNGEGYSGDDLKSLVQLGGKLGLALRALQFGRKMMASPSDGRERSSELI